MTLNTHFCWGLLNLKNVAKETPWTFSKTFASLIYEINYKVLQNKSPCIPFLINVGKSRTFDMFYVF